MTDEPPVLSIGAVLGDPDAESMAWKRAIGALAKQVRSLREGAESPLHVNVVYHVDGRLVANEFTGVRTGRFDRGTRHLMVQAAVPREAVEDRTKVLLELLRNSIDEAESFAVGKGIATDLGAIRALVSVLD